MARFQLSKEARLYRKTLFAGDRLPTDDEKWHVYDDIVDIYGCLGYTRHHHSNWCSDHERGWLKSPRLFIATKLHENPNPTALNVAGWALEIKLPDVDTFRLIGDLLPEAVKAQARFDYSLNHTQLATGAP